MAKKGTHGYFEDENKETSFDDFKTDMTNIDDEVDKILAEQRKAKQQIDFFSDEPIDNNEDEYVFDNSSSRELKSNSPRRNTYAENIETEEAEPEAKEPQGSHSANPSDSSESRINRSSGSRSSSSKSSRGSKDKKKKSKKKDKGHSSHNSHENHSSNRRDNSKSDNRKAEKSSKRNDKSKSHSEKKKHTGLKTFIVIIIILGALCGGVYAYFGHIPTKEDIQSLLPMSDSAEPTSSASIHETLVAITVSGDTVTYNGEVLSSVDELNNRLSKETDPTISLINNDANASTYNKVVEIVNNYGGNFETMDEDNTNPSINTEENSTEENTTESVAESTTEPTSESTSLAE
ncbi:MAG: hypothetical protein PUF23_06690 [Ruminococcus sp.]|nr:hypothetical protein [Ruminococcus sp.]MDD6532014.1 hypothetical protein [Ruminococcus sp.]